MSELDQITLFFLNDLKHKLYWCRRVCEQTINDLNLLLTKQEIIKKLGIEKDVRDIIRELSTAANELEKIRKNIDIRKLFERE